MSQTSKNQTLGVKDFGITKSDTTLPPEAFAQAIRGLLHNWRQGTVGCQTRSQVTASTKKPWRQKGTGRARVGSVKSPLWRGGGVIFGPQQRTRTLKVTKKLRHAVVRDILQGVLENNRLLIVDWSLQGDKPNTKQAFEMIKTAKLENKQVNVFMTPNDLLTAKSFLNIPSARIVFTDAPNAYVLSDAQYWVVFKKDIDAFKTMVAQWT
ncbi:MAG: large subunit ribosomal protein L4 [Alteromonas naphthalenivorans]|jgi:large subunit ribosomal protein L4